MKNWIGRLCGLALLALNSAWAAPVDLAKAAEQAEQLSPAPLLDRMTVLRGNRIRSVNQSPDGRWLSYLRSNAEEHNPLATLWLYNIEDKVFHKRFTFKDVQAVRWSGDSQHLFLQIPSAIAVSPVSGSPKPVVLAKLNRRGHDRLLAVEGYGRASVLLRLQDRKTKQYQAVRVDADGTREVLYQSQVEFNYAWTNPEGELEVIREIDDTLDGQGRSMLKDITKKDQPVLWHCNWDDPCSLYHYQRAQNRLLLVSNHQSDKLRPMWADTKTGKVTEIHRDPADYVDVSALQFDWHQKDNPLVMTSYLGDKLASYGLSQDIQRHIDRLNSEINGYSLYLHYPQAGGRYWLATDNNPAQAHRRHYVYDTQTGKVTEPLAQTVIEANAKTPGMSPEHIAPKFAIRYPADDGFMLHGYLTLPRGVKAKDAPLVVKIHGGPWSRVEEGFDRSVQFLANRGYAVFQPNFRSSTGFGKAWLQGSMGGHGNGRAHADIIDGVRYLLAQGIGDPDRVAAVGHSYGGFSTLGALAFTPDLFKVGFAGAPPSDIGRSARHFYRYNKMTQQPLREYFIKRHIVDYDDKAAFADHYKRSPLYHADKVKAPLMIWAGEHDRRVFVVDVKNYALTLDAANKPVSLFVDPNALHSPSNKVGIDAYHYLLEKTLAEHLGGRLQALDKTKDARLASFLKRNMVLEHNIKL